MTTDERLDEIRQSTLDRTIADMERWQIWSNGFFWAGAVCELFLGLAFLLTVDYSNPTHVVLVLAVATIYVPLGLFLLSLSWQLERHVSRILSAIDAREETQPESREQSD